MADPDSADRYAELEKHREYLAFLARLQLDQKLQAKVDLSGIIQQTLFEAHQAFPESRFDDSSACLAWLRKIMANNLADEIRRATNGKRDANRELSLAGIEQSSVHLQTWLAGDLPSPSQPLCRQELEAQISEALSQLLPSEREAIILRVWENKKSSEIAEQMGRTRVAVAGLLKRGFRKLRAKFAGFDGEN